MARPSVERHSERRSFQRRHRLSNGGYSPTDDDSVAGSFDELIRALSGDKPLDSMPWSRTMLRPMLKTWLDDNLPLMVERLVREEIDRVSRGRR